MRKKYVFSKNLKSFGENRVMIPLEKKKLYRKSRAEGHGATVDWSMKERLLNEEVSLKIEFPEVQSMNDRASIRSQAGPGRAHL